MLALVLAAQLAAAPTPSTVGPRLTDPYEEGWNSRELLAAGMGVLAADLVADLVLVFYIPLIDNASGETGLKLLVLAAIEIVAIDFAIAPLAAVAAAHLFGHEGDMKGRGIGYGYLWEGLSGGLNLLLYGLAYVLASPVMLGVAIGVAALTHFVGLPLAVVKGMHGKRESPPQALAWSF